MVILHLYSSTWHGIAHICIIYLCREVSHIYRAIQLGHTSLTRKLQTCISTALGFRYHALQQRVEHQHRQIVERTLGIISVRCGRVITLHNIATRAAILHLHPHALTLHIVT